MVGAGGYFVLDRLRGGRVSSLLCPEQRALAGLWVLRDSSGSTFVLPPCEPMGIQGNGMAIQTLGSTVEMLGKMEAKKAGEYGKNRN